MSSVIIPEEMTGTRLDKALSQLVPELSRARIQALIADGHVTRDGVVEGNQKHAVIAGEAYTITLPDIKPATLAAENIPLDVVYEDDALLVINKPVGLVVHPGAGVADGTLVNALLHHCGDSLSGIGGEARPGIVHRLDKDTSGLMLVAKTDAAHQHLSEQLADRSLSRTYECLVWGAPMPPIGTVDAAIGRHPRDRTRMSTRGVSSRAAQTHYRVLNKDNAGRIAHLECRLESGRTHQIRVHMQHLGHPLIGDPTYGAQKTKQQSDINQSSVAEADRNAFLTFPRQALHAHAIRFIHPDSGTEMAFDAPAPGDLQALITLMRAKT